MAEQSLPDTSPWITNNTPLGYNTIHEDDPYGTIDHTIEDNPYKSKYQSEWRNEIKRCRLLSPYVCVTDLVTHIITKSKKVMTGTKHENDWYFYHNALSLMTSDKH